MGDFNDPFNRNRDAAVQARAKQQNRANVLQLKLIGQSHPTGLTSNLLKLFEPRPPLEHKPPPEKRKCPPYTGMAQFVSKFAEPGDREYAPPVQKGETPAERKARIHRHQLEKGAIKAAEELQKYDPSKDPNVSGDPYKTLFVARLSYETTEHRIKREFEAYGPIKRVRLITNSETNKPRGYAFVEYMHTRDMKTAYKQADGQKMDGRRVLVDVERGRTVPNWRPRRLGGGLGSTRVGGEEVNQKYSGREPQQLGSGASRSEEPRAREDHHVDRDREKSRERGRDREREREKSHERSHDRIRERDPREERHHRDRDRNRDRDKERSRGLDRDRDNDWARDRDRDRGRDRGRDRDRDRDYARDRDRARDPDRDRDRDRIRDHRRSRERDYERGDRERTRERENDYDYVETRRNKREPEGEREEELEHGEHDRDHDLFDGPDNHGHAFEHLEPDRGYKHYKPERGYGHHDDEPPNNQEQYKHPEQGNGNEPCDDPVHDYDHHYERAQPNNDHRDYDHAETDPRDQERTREGHERSKRSMSRDYER